MGIQTTWMRQNMLGSPYSQNGRELTPAEKKVQRSIEKLSVPEWYRNRQTDAPITLKSTYLDSIKNRMTFWKNSTPQNSPGVNRMSKEKSLAEIHDKSVESLDRSISSVSDKISFYESECEKSSQSTSYRPIAFKSSNRGNTNNNYSIYKSWHKSSEMDRTIDQLETSNATNESFDTSLPDVRYSLNKSGTFPKMSPSRKVENINIPLPLLPKLELSIPDHDEPGTEEFRHLTYIKTPKKSMEKGRQEKEYPRKNIQSRINQKYFQFPAASTLQYSSSAFDSSFDEEKSHYVKSRKQITSDKRPIHSANKNLVSPTQNRAHLREHSDFSSPSARFFAAKNKSTVMETIVKQKLRPERRKTVQQLVKNFNEKSRRSRTVDDSLNSTSASSTCGQNTLVRRFVRALERGYMEEAREIMTESWEEDRSEDSDSDVMASSFLSTTISIPDSECDISMNSDEFRLRYLHEDESPEKREAVREEANKEQGEKDEPVYWIPMPNVEYGRTSSVLSMISVLSNLPSPSVSPIRSSDTDVPSFPYDSLGSSISKQSNSSLRFAKETVVTDSGISDRSNGFDKSYSRSSLDLEDSSCDDYHSDSSFDTVDKKIAFFDRKQRAYQRRQRRSANKYRSYV